MQNDNNNNNQNYFNINRNNNFNIISNNNRNLNNKLLKKMEHLTYIIIHLIIIILMQIK